MPDIVYCDNKDCICYDDYRERCDAYRLVIERGVCMGSSRHGRNVSENDLDEQLKAENASLRGAAQGLGELCDKYKAENEKLRDLVDLMLSCPMDKGDCDKCRQLNDMCEVEVLAGELGIEVK